VTNTIVYYNKLLVSEYLVIYKFGGKARVYVADKSLQPSLMFVGNPESHPKVEHLKYASVGFFSSKLPTLS